MIRALILISALLVTMAANSQEEIFPGYQWQKVVDGVYLHSSINPLAGPVDGNSVVIVSDNGIVVIDTHINPAAARAVIQKIRQLANRPVTHVINTHWHDDHTNGNYVYREAYPNVQIVSHRKTLEAMKREWAPMEEQRAKAYAAVDPEQLLDRANTAEDPNRAEGFRVYAGYVAALKSELPSLKLVYPDTVFDDEFILESSERRIVVKWPGRGNTDGDVVVWLPDDKVLITGDLVVAPIPFAFDSPMLDWIDTLGRLLLYDAKIVIPGHGPVQQNKVQIEQILSLLTTTISEVRAAHDNGTHYSDLASAVDLNLHEKQFTEGDPERIFAWRSYYFAPGLKSAWASLGHPVIEAIEP